MVIPAIFFLASSFIVNAAPQFDSGRGKGLCQLLDSENNSVGTISFNFRVSEKIHPKHGPVYGFIEIEIDMENDGIVDTIISLTDIDIINFGYSIIPEWIYGYQCKLEGMASITDADMGYIGDEYIVVKLHDKASTDDFDRIDFQMDTQTFNIGEIISGNISIKIAGFNSRR